MSTTTVQRPVQENLDLPALGAPPMAQVNLLPPEVHSRRALGRTKLRLAGVVGGVVLLAGLGIGYAVFAESQATANLEIAEQETQRLLAEQAKYAEVPQIKAEISRVEQARGLGTATEVLWPDYLGAIQAVVPDGVTVVDMATNMPGPLTLPTMSSNPLDSAHVGSITFVGQARSLPDLAAWRDALERVPGFVDASFATAEITSENGVVHFAITTSVLVTDAVYADRHAPQETE